jgi:alpha-beta hydrolase superfamily lysophospholipase
VATPSRWLKPVRWAWRHKIVTTVGLVVIALVGLNVSALLHARAMTHFSTGGARTAKPEALSFSEKVRALLLGVNIPRPENTSTPAFLDLPFETQTITEADGTVLEVWDIPAERPRGVVVLFHSYASSKSALLREARAFHDMGFAACLVDFRGSGGSSGNVTTVGVREADDVVAATAHAGVLAPDKPCILYGQSMGSAAILRALAVHDVKADAIVIECPFDRLESTVANRFTAMHLPAWPGAPLLVFWGGVQCGFNGFDHNPADYARDVRVPVLLLHGSADPRVTPEQVQSVFNNLAGEKKLELLEGAGHQPYLDTHTERWQRLVRQFLDASLPDN